MATQDLQQALVEEIRDLYSAEKQITKALPKLIKQAEDEELKNALNEHLEVTKNQVERLEQVFSELGMKPRAKSCEAMKGIVSEGEDLAEKDAEPAVKDAMLIAAAQKVEHYEIGSYGTACAWAETLGLDSISELLQETLEEERQADKELSKIAKRINKAALNGSAMAA
ncbi:MAG: ferritin-like domain-containing protein [Bdellovibrionales bacterium]|nr:ferritin-like domain-containing protein [Bdellovibrionales bacterium]